MAEHFSCLQRPSDNEIADYLPVVVPDGLWFGANIGLAVHHFSDQVVE
jgi:hypothetical protein